MRLTKAGNSNIVIEYAARKLLVDPVIDDISHHSVPRHLKSSYSKCNLSGLPFSIETLFDVDALIITPGHMDHWNEITHKLAPKDIPIISCSEQTSEHIRSQGFVNVFALNDGLEYGDIYFSKPHGLKNPKRVTNMDRQCFQAEACGLVLTHPGEKTMFIMNREAKENISEPRVITNCCDLVVVNVMA